MFLQIINKTALLHHIVLHAYVLMDNNYHLLIENSKENLSSFMRIVNANYAQYFNKKYSRSGHLWQDRYKSKFITGDSYLYTLIRYIEYNPIEANIAQTVSSYSYTLTHCLFNAKAYPASSRSSILLTQFDLITVAGFLDKPLSDKELKSLNAKEKIKVEVINERISVSSIRHLDQHFCETSTKKDRNIAIVNAFEEGHTQVDIANYLDLSTSLVSKVIKSGYSTPGA